MNYNKLYECISKLVDGAVLEMRHVDISSLEDQYMGKTIRIINMKDEPNYNGKVGTVTRIENTPGNEPLMHGTWGGLAVIFGVDEFEVIE